jgi:hypothetical protein
LLLSPQTFALSPAASFVLGTHYFEQWRDALRRDLKHMDQVVDQQLARGYKQARVALQELDHVIQVAHMRGAVGSKPCERLWQAKGIAADNLHDRVELFLILHVEYTDTRID